MQRWWRDDGDGGGGGRVVVRCWLQAGGRRRLGAAESAGLMAGRRRLVGNLVTIAISIAMEQYR